MPLHTFPAPQTDVVDDLGSSNASVVLILESPHIDEVNHGYPACGPAGINMSRVLLGRADASITLLIKFPRIAQIIGVTHLPPITVMNVSQRPLQKEAYDAHPTLTPPNNIGALQKLKETIQGASSTQKQVFKDDREEAQNQLYQDFSNRFRQHWSQAQLIIPCGKFAHHFLSWYLEENPGPPPAILYDLPHPSKPGDFWSKPNPSDDRYRLLRKLADPGSLDEVVRDVRQIGLTETLER